MTQVFCALVADDAYRPAVCNGQGSPVQADVDDLITVASTADVATKRAALIAYVWPGGYPAGSPAETLGVIEARFDGLLNLASIDLLTFTLPFTQTQYGWRLNPTAGANGRAFIYVSGHGQSIATPETRLALMGALRAGYTVVVLDSPFFGDSSSAVYDAVEYSVAIQGSDIHRVFAEAVEDDEGPVGDVLALFFQPAIEVLNMLAGDGVTDVTMCGLSGGAWITTFVSALDERVRRSYPVSGSIPWYRRTAAADQGDWEQYVAVLLDRCEYLDAYVMATSNRRRQVQLLGWYDSIFLPSHLADYAASVKRRAAQLGGSWDSRGDRSYVGHMVSPGMMAFILQDIA